MKMKLVLCIMIVISIKVDGAHEQFNLRHHIPNRNPRIFSSESSYYLPSESHTPLPFLSIQDFKNPPLSYLPPHKGNAMFSTPFPFLVTTTLIPSEGSEEEDDDDRSTYERQENKSLTKSHPLIKNYNRTATVTPAQHIKREMKPLTKNSQFSQQIDRKDLKPFPFAPNNLFNTMKNTVSQAATPRSLIISPENNKVDQIKSGSFLAPQYLTSPGLFISSTVEPVIPIIRLSNEMDLDGSFSYEALGADQTHYVQHSRMENVGNDKQEQVVEGSYSYVGDNGQTYTVHYIADSNGFRATGEHLPVAPPIPEIIQRAIQFNLAEEARNPVIYTNSWEHGNNENEISESEKSHRFAFSPPQNLFTGKTPESFSHGFTQMFNKEDDLLPAASKNIIKTVDFASDQIKPKMSTETISPQITFIASQGAHVPSINKSQQQSQQTIARMFSTEKPTMPQLMNYEAAIKDEQENNKALWRWQYGLSAMNDQSSNKNSISRSSNDDVIINFNDMTPEQYSQMIKSEIQSNNDDEQQDNTNNRASTDEIQSNNLSQYSTPSSISATQYKNNQYVLNSETKLYSEKSNYPKKSNNQSRSDARAKLITLSEFLPPSQTVTQSYDYIENFENRKTKSFEEEINNLNVIPLSKNNKTPMTWSNIKSIDDSPLLENTYQESLKSSTPSNSKFSDFIVRESDILKPVGKKPEQIPELTTEIKLEDALKDNLFLKSVFSNNSKLTNKSNNEAKEYNLQHKANAEMTPNKFSHDRSIKYFALQARPFEEPNRLSKNSVGMADIIRLMSSKKSFESNKVRPRIRSEYNDVQTKTNNLYQSSTEKLIPEFEHQDNEPKTEKNYENLNHQQQEELKGLIKNYKVLQRKNNGYSNEERMDYLRRMSPSVLGNMQTSLPPLGRAGPSTKSYLPPIYI